MSRPRFHYAWVIAASPFWCCWSRPAFAPRRRSDGAAGEEFGWSRTIISAAVAINIALFGLIGPFAASVMDRWGLRRIVSARGGAAGGLRRADDADAHQWELTLLWGVLVGTGTGVTSMVLAAIVATRWFDERRGLVMGALSAANATGQLVFLPLLASARGERGWRAAALVPRRSRGRVSQSSCCSCATGRRISACGRTAIAPALRAAGRRRALAPLAALRYAVRLRAFWMLAGTFFICGASTNGLIGTHLIPACHDYGISEVRAAGCSP